MMVKTLPSRGINQITTAFIIIPLTLKEMSVSILKKDLPEILWNTTIVQVKKIRNRAEWIRAVVKIFFAITKLRVIEEPESDWEEMKITTELKTKFMEI